MVAAALLAVVSADNVIVCGGFVKAASQLDYSKISVNIFICPVGVLLVLIRVGSR